MSTLQDRRRHSRQVISLPLYVGLNRSSAGGIMHDVSEGGVALDLVVGPKPVSDDVLLDLNLSGIGEHFEAKARITWTKQPENRIGLNFVDLTEASRLQIKKWLSANDAPEQDPEVGEMVDFHRLLAPEVKVESLTVKNIDERDKQGIGQARRSTAKFKKSPETPIPRKSRETKKLIPAGLEENLVIRNSGKNDSSLQHPVRQVEKTVKSAALCAKDATETKPLDAKVSEDFMPASAYGICAKISSPDIRTETNETATNARDLQVPETLKGPTVVPEQGDQLVQEIKKWLESVSAELRQSVQIQDGPKHGAPVQCPLPQLEEKDQPAALRALDVTESKAVKAEVPEAKTVRIAASSPSLRSETEEPATSVQEPQAPETPQSSAVAPKRGKRLVGEIKKWFVNELETEELEHNVIQNPAGDGASVQHPVWQIKKIAEPAASGVIGVTETKSVEADGRAANRFADPGPGLWSERKEPTTIERGMQVPKSPAAGPEHGDKLVQALRSSFGQLEAPSVRASSPEGKTQVEAFDREILRRWILASVVIFLLIVSLAAARWIYTSPALDKITSASDIREMVAGRLTSGRPEKSKVADNVDLNSAAKVERQSRREMRRPKSNEIRGSSAGADPTSRAKVKDAENGQRTVAQTGATVASPSEQAGFLDTTQVSGAQRIPGLQTEEPVKTELGHVSLHSAAEVPVKMILPDYPPAALQKNVQGRVILKALIGKDGRLKNIRLVGDPSLLSAAVLEAVKKWRYRSRMENGMPVEVETQITIDFEE